LRAIEAVNVGDRTARVQAGTRLSALNQQLARANSFSQFDLGADPAIGGMIASNTGGSRLLRYGDVQRNLLGLEVVLADADATVLTDMKALRKDNSGIDLKQFVGRNRGYIRNHHGRAVGSSPSAAQTATALLVPARQEAIPELLNRLEAEAGEFLAAFEGCRPTRSKPQCCHNPRIRNPFGPGAVPAYTVLV